MMFHKYVTILLMNSTNSLENLLRLYPNKEWTWHCLSSTPNITWEMVRDNPNKPWIWNGLSYNPNITWEIVQNNFDKPWDWYVFRLIQILRGKLSKIIQINRGIGMVFRKIQILRWTQ
jgi:hypothetical protein